MNTIQFGVDQPPAKIVFVSEGSFIFKKNKNIFKLRRITLELTKF